MDLPQSLHEVWNGLLDIIGVWFVESNNGLRTREADAKLYGQRT